MHGFQNNLAQLFSLSLSGLSITYTFIVAPALARCDIGIRFSVRPSFRPQFTSTLAFKSIQMTNSLKPLQNSKI